MTFGGALWLFRRPRLFRHPRLFQRHVTIDYFGAEAAALQLMFRFKKHAQRCLPVIFLFVGYGFVG